jgi:hypothetical protein
MTVVIKKPGETISPGSGRQSYSDVAKKFRHVMSPVSFCQ